MLLGCQLEKLEQTMPQRHCPWRADVAPTLGLTMREPAVLIRGHYVPDVVLPEISWIWAMEVGAKVPYSRWYLFLRLIKRKKDEKLYWYIFILSRTTTAQVDHDNKIAVVRRRHPELVMITLVRSRGHNIGATRNH